MIPTERVTVTIPRDGLAEARKRYPELRVLSNGRILRYSLARALLGKSHDEAIEYTRDVRGFDKQTSA